ncbi:hypothetical protein [Ferruginibacter profundus]
MISVFKTSVKTNLQVKQLKPHIDSLLPNATWNFDLTDCDKILRIDGEDNVVLKIIDLLNRHNYYCEELE